ncbi:hypothetical protein ACQWG0_25070, partial [Salmonella enterica subsp. enterica serovar Infantis]
PSQVRGVCYRGCWGFFTPCMIFILFVSPFFNLALIYLAFVFLMIFLLHGGFFAAKLLNSNLGSSRI